MFSKNGGTAGIPVYTVLEIQNNGSVTIFTRARTTSRLGPSTGKTLARLGFKFNVYTVKIIRAVLLFWVHRPFFIRAVPKEDLNVNGASNDYVFFFFITMAAGGWGLGYWYVFKIVVSVVVQTFYYVFHSFGQSTFENIWKKIYSQNLQESK